MKNFYQSDKINERWNTEMDFLKQYSNMVEEGEVIAKKSCYYPRLKETNKRGRVAFIELYKQICCEGKERMMKIENFELFICKHKEWKVHIQPTDKHGKMCADWILETDGNDMVFEYLKDFEYLMTSVMPSINTELYQHVDNVSAIKNLASNLEITGEEAIQIIKYFLAGLEQLSSLGDSP